MDVHFLLVNIDFHKSSTYGCTRIELGRNFGHSIFQVNSIDDLNRVYYLTRKISSWVGLSSHNKCYIDNQSRIKFKYQIFTSHDTLLTFDTNIKYS